jgi:hypothetical protein
VSGREDLAAFQAEQLAVYTRLVATDRTASFLQIRGCGLLVAAVGPADETTALIEAITRGCAPTQETDG